MACPCQDACPSPDDLLPGLCALTEKWLAEVALPSFRGSPSQTGTLTDWFQDRRVSLYLQVADAAHVCHKSHTELPMSDLEIDWPHPNTSSPPTPRAPSTNLLCPWALT